MAKLDDLARKMDIKPETKIITPNKPTEHTTKRRTWLENEEDEKIVLLDSRDIRNWEYHDRPESELGDLKSLANEFKSIGQQQPCIVRCTDINDRYKYELIVGERRWRASQIANVKLKCIIKEISDSDSALIQSAENDNRKDLSDYAKGLSYSKLIDNNIITQSLLTEKLGRNKQYVSALLSYSKIPDNIINSIGDMSKVSYRTAETIKRLSSKGDDYIEAIISISSELSSGKVGANKLSLKVSNYINNSSINPQARENKKIKSEDGRHLFTWRNDNNNNPSIHFPKDITDLILNSNISIEKITDKIKKEISNELNNMKK